MKQQFSRPYASWPTLIVVYYLCKVIAIAIRESRGCSVIPGNCCTNAQNRKPEADVQTELVLTEAGLTFMPSSCGTSQSHILNHSFSLIL